MKDGEFDTVSILNAKEAKLHALSVIKILKTTENQQAIINDVIDVKTGVYLHKLK